MPTHHHGPAAEVRALDAFIKLLRASDTISAYVHRPLGAWGLSVSQFAVLEALYHLGPMCQRALAAKLLKTGGNITMVIDNLERRGLVRRERSARDRRMITVTLTTAGRELITGVFPAHAAHLAAAFAALTPAEQHQLAALCKKLGVAVARQDAASPPEPATQRATGT